MYNKLNKPDIAVEVINKKPILENALVELGTVKYNSNQTQNIKIFSVWNDKGVEVSMLNGSINARFNLDSFQIEYNSPPMSKTLQSDGVTSSKNYSYGFEVDLSEEGHVTTYINSYDNQLSVGNVLMRNALGFYSSTNIQKTLFISAVALTAIYAQPALPLLLTRVASH